MTETMWTCCTGDVYDTPGLREHLKEVHGITSTKMQVIDSMHLDLEGGVALNSYECQIEGITVSKTVKVTPESEDGS